MADGFRVGGIKLSLKVAIRQLKVELPTMKPHGSRSTAGSTLVVLLVLTFLAQPGSAMIEVTAEDVKKQQKSPEVLTIQVQSFQEVEKSRDKEVRKTAARVVAKVLKVKRSASKVKVGDTIQIEYERVVSFEPTMGPGEYPALKKGQVSPAFLKRTKSRDIYEPAFGELSFQEL